MRALTAITVFALTSAASAGASAQTTLSDRVYVVQQGDTVSRIAQRLQVSVADLVERNYLQRPYNLRIGRKLRPPQNTPREVLRTLPHRDGTPGESARGAPAPSASQLPPGQTRLRREGGGDSETFDLAHLDARGARRLANFLRLDAEEGARQPAPVPLHPRMTFVLSRVSQNFAGRTVRISPNGRARGAEPVGPTTNHGRGTAVDIRVDGVSLQALHEYCLTLDRVGCGIHRRANYVHIDVRRERATWDDTGAILPLANNRPR
jgi:LysM repeat protein